MARWFLSYHSPDQALAEQLRATIEGKDAAARVFFAPANLRAGGSWSAQLAQEIVDATAFILLIGQAGIGKWQVPEYDEALDKWVKSDRKFPLIVVLLEGQTAPGLPFLRQLHWIVTPDPSSEKDIARIFDALSGSGSSPGELWRYTSPYRGLEAMEDKDSDYFFGRKSETVEVLSALAGAPDRLPILIGNSGVGKSSLAQAGVLASLKRQAWPEDCQAPNAWPAAFEGSRQWCFLSLKPGTDPLKSLIESFLDTWQYAATDPERVTRQHGWVEALRGGNATLPDLIDATERRRKELGQPKPPGFFLYVDQGEELYARAEESQQQRFSELLAQALSDPRLHLMMSMRSDFLGHLQADKPLFKARQQIDVPPLGQEELREIVSRPAQLLSARFESDGLIEIISRRTAEDSVKDVGALPLLSYTLDDMWASMMQRGDGTLRLPAPSFELGGVLVDRANRFLETHSGAEDALRRVLTLRLATVREDGEPTRRRAARGEFTDEEWRLVSELADYPNRLLVVAATPAGETYAEVTHEAIFRRWSRLREWIATEREFLAWRHGLESARRAWMAAPERSKRDALLMGLALAQARNWLAKRGADLPDADRRFIEQSRKTARGRSLRTRILIGALALPVAAILLLFAVVWGRYEWQELTVMRSFLNDNVQPYVLSASAESVFKPADTFRECASPPGKDYCPQMVVVPAGQFTMGSPEVPMSDLPNTTVQQIVASVQPQHKVTIPAAFAVSKNEITFEEWDTSVADGHCSEVDDYGFGRGQQPVIGVSLSGAQCYVAWLSKMTGKNYRLLSEAEYEYAARAGTQTAYPWGDQAGTNNANCKDCGSQWDGVKPAPVGSFPPNAFGLNDMAGNVFEWVADCWHDSYQSAPTDGSPWLTGGDCTRRAIRGGSYYYPSTTVMSAFRYWAKDNTWGTTLGFRVARALVPPGAVRQ
jgi:formylglycine-generating enzyme required for sulfatase activity